MARQTARTTPRKERQPPPPLDAAALDRLALRYVERFATSRGKLTEYLSRKVRERGWSGDPVDPASVAERMAGLGYVDDRAFAEARVRSLSRRGFGARRVAQALQVARIGVDDAIAALEPVAETALDTALAFARRRRIGPFADAPSDPKLRARQMAAMIRAGHSYALTRRIVESAPGTTFESDM